MKTVIYRFFAIVTLLVVISCNQSPESFIQTDPDRLYFNSTASSLTLKVTSSEDWDILNFPYWCSVSSKNGNSGDELHVSVIDNEGEERTGEILIVCGNATFRVEVTQFAKVSTNYVELKLEEEGTSYTYSERTGRLIITYEDGSVPQVEVGQAVVLSYEHDFDIRLIDDVSSSVDGTLSISTSQGDMGDLFKNISFSLSTVKGNNTKSSIGHPVYSPVAFGYINDSGDYFEVSCNNITKLEDFKTSNNLLSLQKNWNGETIIEGWAGKLYWENCAIDFNLDGYFHFDFGNEIKQFNCALNGNFGADMLLHYSYTRNYADEFEEIIKKDIIKPIVIKFQVGAVPIYIDISTDLGNSLMLSAEGEVDMSAGFILSTNMKVELDWEMGEEPKVTYEFSPTFKLHYPTFDIHASADAKLSIYPHVDINFYKIGGPWIEPRPYLKENVDAGVHTSLDGDSYVGWQATTYCGLDLQLGLGVSFLKKDQLSWKSNLYSPIEDYLIYNAPQNVTISFPQNDIGVRSDQVINVKCVVEAYSPIKDSYYPCHPIIVKFNDDYGLEQYCSSENSTGIVYIDWIPFKSAYVNSNETEMSNVLTAMIFDSEGNVICMDTVSVYLDYQEEEDNNENEGEEEDNNDDDEEDNSKDDEEDSPNEGDDNGNMVSFEAIDLGLSVKWAPCNVGANKPEEYGFHFAWGEVEPKETYYKDNYIYYIEDEYRYVDIGNEISGTQYDVASSMWGNGWRMPTADEILELHNSCSCEIGNMNGVNGYYYIAPNGNRIFFPFAGVKYKSETMKVGSITMFWSGTLCDTNNDRYNYAYHGQVSQGILQSQRYYGLSIRPVKD